MPGAMPAPPKPPTPPSKDQAAINVLEQGRKKAPVGFSSTILGDNKTTPVGQTKTLFGE